MKDGMQHLKNKTLAAPQYSVNLDGTSSTNDNHFDNHFKAISIQPQGQSVRSVKTKVLGDRAVDHSVEVPDAIKEIVHVEQD